MPKTIGFIDYFIDEWHAQNYPRMIRESRLGERFEVALAWEQFTPEGKMSLDQWCAQHKVGQADSIEQVVNECDVLIVLSPDNGEMHETLADLPLKSGKPTYIDKPIALMHDQAKRMYEKAAAHATPVMSSSALRFGSKFQEAVQGSIAADRPHFAHALGPGEFPIYGVHQLEMIVAAMGPGAERVMHTGNAATTHLTIDFGHGRRAVMTNLPGAAFEIATYAGRDNDAGKAVIVKEQTDFFERFIDAMLGFFDVGESPIDPAETLTIAGLIEAGIAATKTPDQWVDVPR